MQQRQDRVPSYDALRPIEGETDTFPVYKQLVEDLASVSRGTYHPTAAHVCAVVAGWAYADADTAATMAARLCLRENFFLAHRRRRQPRADEGRDMVPAE